MTTVSAKITETAVTTSIGNDDGKQLARESFEHNALDELRKHTTIVADSGDFECFEKYSPVDATTNPSLILAAVNIENKYDDVVEEAIRRALIRAQDKEDVDKLVPLMCEELLVEFACRMLEHIPGLVSVEVDPELSFDKEGSIRRARELMALFEARGQDKKRLAFKLASTWEGFEAARILEAEGIQCNMTLMFCMPQAIAAAEAGATLVSPYVGRILEWHKKHSGKEYTSETDPGIIGVKEIYNYYKRFGYKSLVMGASFRNVEEVIGLAGCDNLTVAPKWLDNLKELPASLVKPQMSAEAPLVFAGYEEKITYDHSKFMWELINCQHAIELLCDGLRKFDADWTLLKNILRERCQKFSAK